MYSPGPVSGFSDKDDVSENQNNCYWPLHSESIARCKHHMQEKLIYIAAHIWKIYDFKIEVIPFIINCSTELPIVVKCGLFNFQLRRTYQWKKFCKSRIIDRENVINIPVCEINVKATKQVNKYIVYDLDAMSVHI